MNSAQRRGRLLLWVHLFVCMVWFYVYRAEGDKPGWMMHVFFWSVLGVQFTWGYTVGLLVGPGRRNRGKLWWSLLLVFMPLYPLSFLFRVFLHFFSLPIAMTYILLVVATLACQTFGGVLLGVRAHGADRS